jgi:undecaprenyl diphosphate synthase
MITHVAFIMDGNRRWAKERKLPLSAGHTKGYKAIEPLINFAHKKGIKHVTFWAFSTENWNRDQKEVALLMQIFRRLFKGSIFKRLHKNGVRIRILGELDPFPEDIAKKVREIVEETKHNTAITVNIALNYGGRAEILRAVNKILREKQSFVIPAKAGIHTRGSRIKSGMTMEIDEETFAHYLYTEDQPDPDMIIRTSGEERLSGFLPWQGAYSELYFPKTYWPDFDEKEFEKALLEFENRQRRFGK